MIFSEIITLGGHLPFPIFLYMLMIYEGDGSNADHPDTLDLPWGIVRGGYGNAPAVADINKDGVPELVVLCKDKYIRVFTDFDLGGIPPNDAMGHFTPT